MNVTTNDPHPASSGRPVTRPAAGSASERVYETVRADILDGAYQPGAKLSEIALGQAVHASRTPVREALRLLARDGLVQISPNRGARVVRWDADDLDSLFPLRTMLESHGAGRAAEHRSGTALDTMRRLIDRMDALSSDLDEALLVERARLDNQLHQTIMEAAASPHLMASLRPLIHMSLITRTFRVYSTAATARSQQQHHDLLDAIEAGNADLARAVMSSHFLAAYQEVRERADS